MVIDRNLSIALFATVVSFSTLYVPQPMLPLLAAEFAISPGQAGLLMTVTMLPLAVAPIFYGYFLQAIPARLMLQVALSLLAINQVGICFVDEFWTLLLMRLIQGLLLPAIFTALMTYCAGMVPRDKVRRAMGYYIGATILGGFSGRLVGGVFASGFDWHIAFLVIGLLQLIPLWLLRQVDSDADINFARLDARSLLRVFANTDYRLMFLALSCVFFVFSGILNLIPFRLEAINPSATPFLISMLYLGYLIGAPVSFFSDKIAQRIDDHRAGLMLGLLVHAFGLVMLLLVAFKGMLVMMFFLAAGFFLIHALLSGLANHLASEHRGVVNGIYVSVYYFSGALGSWLPGYFYAGVGWNGMIFIFVGLLLLSGFSIFRFRPASK